MVPMTIMLIDWEMWVRNEIQKEYKRKTRTISSICRFGMELTAGNLIPTFKKKEEDMTDEEKAKRAEKKHFLFRDLR